jgi:hypothetical protein
MFKAAEDRLGVAWLGCLCAKEYKYIVRRYVLLNVALALVQVYTITRTVYGAGLGWIRVPIWTVVIHIGPRLRVPNKPTYSSL